MTDAATQTGWDGARVSAAAPCQTRLVRAVPGGLAQRQARSARVQILIRDGRHVDDSLARSGRNRTTRTLRRDLREVTREIRPDWDLSAPGLRAAWDAGDHARHHPYRQVDHTRSPAEALSDTDHNTTVRSE